MLQLATHHRREHHIVRVRACHRNRVHWHRREIQVPSPWSRAQIQAQFPIQLMQYRIFTHASRLQIVRMMKNEIKMRTPTRQRHFGHIYLVVRYRVSFVHWDYLIFHDLQYFPFILVVSYCYAYTMSTRNLQKCSLSFPANFLVQFLLLSFMFGIPFLWLQIVLGHKIKGGIVTMFRITPICKGIGISLMISHCIICLYSSVSLGWVLIYLR